MGEYNQVWEQVKAIWPYFVLIAVMTVASIVYGVVSSKNRKKRAGKFLEENPGASEIYLTNKALMVTETVQVHRVNNDKPIMFNKNRKVGFYVKPGSNIIEISYTYTRPGVLYKSVTKSTGLVKQEVEVEPNKAYMLGYDRKVEEFTFEELEA